jgi:ribosomal protein S27AE
MPKISHVHKLKRLRYKSGNDIFFCALPDCAFKTNISLVLGKRSICWRCGESFVMNEYSIRLSKPHCNNCHKPKKETDTRDMGEYMKDSIINGLVGMYSDKPAELSLSERLEQTIHQKQKQEEEEI